MAAYARMTTRERVGQLFIMGVSSTGPYRSELHDLAADAGGNVYLRGDSTQGRRAVRNIVAATRPQLTYAGVRPFIGTDQEGGEVQDLQGPGFNTMPTALSQGRLPAPTLQADAQVWGRQLREAGLNLDLAPVADTVPKSVGTANQPIGQYYREYGHTVSRVRTHAVAFQRGLTAASIATTLKHFPGLGRAPATPTTGTTSPIRPGRAARTSSRFTMASRRGRNSSWCRRRPTRTSTQRSRRASRAR